MNKRYYSYNRIHPLAHQYSLGDWLSKQAGGKAADELWGMTKSGIGDALKGNAANIALGIGSKIINPNGNTTAFSDFGNTVGNLVGMIPGVGTVAGLGIKGITALTDAAFGSNVNEAAVRGLRADLNAAQNNIGSALTWDTLADSVEELGDINVAGADLGSQGWFNHDVDKTRNRLKRQQQMAQAAIDYAADNINTLENRQMIGTALADGGKIHIKPSKKGTFTAQATKMGMGVQEAASHILANKERYSPAMVKKANFAKNASKWHAEGGPIFKTDYDMGLTFINKGGTHEQNPYGGVFMGMAPDGQPNQVEEGEIIFNDYVYSNRLKVPKAVRNKYKLREKEDLSFADAIEEYIKKNGIEERNNDPIANRGLEAFASELAMEQEMVKAKKEMRRQRREFEEGGPIKIKTKEEVDAELAAQIRANRAILDQVGFGGPNRNITIVSKGTYYGGNEGLEELQQKHSAQADSLLQQAIGISAPQDSLVYPSVFFSTPPDQSVGPKTYSGNRLEDLQSRLEETRKKLPYAEGGHLFPNGGTTQYGDYTGDYSKAWGTYVMPGVEKYFTDALTEYNAATDDVARAAIRQRVMDQVNALQRSYAGISSSPLGTKNKNIGAHQTLFNAAGGNYGFNGANESIPGIDALIKRGYTGGTSDNAAGNFAPDDIYGWRTDLRHFGSDSPEDAAAMERIASMANQMKMRWGATLADPGHEGRNLYMLSDPREIENPLQKLGPIEPKSNNELAPRKGVTDATKPNTEQGEQEDTYDPTYWWRMAGLGANAAGLMYNIFDPYHPQVLNEVRAPRMINPKYLGDYMEYTPYDINYATSQQDANSAATRNALMQSTAPIRNASLLANDFNANATRGATRRQALEYNDSLRKAVADFNRGTNQFNAQMYVDAAARNQAAKQAYFQDRLRQAQFNSQLDFQHKMMRDQAIGQGITGIADYLNDMGREGEARSQVGAVVQSGVPLSAPMSDYYYSQYFGYPRKCGGKISRKKK